MAKFIIVNSKKGGALKTTISTNLGSILSLNSKKVLLVDLDAQADVKITFNVDNTDLEYSLYDCLYDDVDIKKCIYPYNDNLDLLLSDERMEDYEFDILTNPKKQVDYMSILQNKLSGVLDDYDYIVIDTSPSASILSIQYMMLDSKNGETTDIILPYQPEIYALKNLIRQINKINKFKSEYNSKLSIKAVVPVKIMQNNTHKMVLTQTKMILDSQNIKMTKTQIKNTIKFSEFLVTDNKPLSLVPDNELLAEFKPFKKIYKDLLKELNYK